MYAGVHYVLLCLAAVATSSAKAARGPKLLSVSSILSDVLERRVSTDFENASVISENSYSVLRLELTYSEPIYFHQRKNASDENVLALGDHGVLDLAGLVDVECEGKVYKFVHEHHFSGSKYGMFDFGAASSKRAQAGVVPTIRNTKSTPTECTSNNFCLLLHVPSTTADSFGCTVGFSRHPRNGTSRFFLGNFQGDAIASNDLRLPNVLRDSLKERATTYAVEPKFLSERPGRTGNGSRGGARPKAEPKADGLQKGQCNLVDSILHNKSAAIQKAFQNGAVLNDGSVMSAMEVHAALDSHLRDHAGMMASTINTVLDGAEPLIVQDIMANTNSRSATSMARYFNAEMPEIIGAEVPTVVSQMLDLALTYNLTNILTDSITAAVVPRLSSDIFRGVVIPIEQEVKKEAVRRVPRVVSNVVEATTSARISKAVPRLLERSLSTKLTYTLTRSITHALVPTLAGSLSHSRDQNYYCWACYDHKAHCNKCHYSAQSSYYNDYYSDYYSDYYGDYYGDYYADSLRAIEYQHIKEERHPIPPA
eukprot:g3345.t1